MIAVSGHALHAAAEAGFRHAVVIEHHAFEGLLQTVAYGRIKDVAARLYAFHAAGEAPERFILLHGGKERGKLMGGGHKTLRMPAGKIGAQCFRTGLGLTCHHVHARGGERLTQQIRHAVGTLRAGQKNHEALARMHELRHACGKERGGSGEVAFGKGDAFGEVRGAGGLKSDYALHIALRHAEKFPVVPKILRRGEGQTTKIVGTFQIEIVSGEGSTVPAAEGKGALQRSAQGVEAGFFQPFGKGKGGIAAALCVEPGIQPRRGKRRKFHERSSCLHAER